MLQTLWLRLLVCWSVTPLHSLKWAGNDKIEFAVINNGVRAVKVAICTTIRLHMVYVSGKRPTVRVNSSFNELKGIMMIFHMSRQLRKTTNHRRPAEIVGWDDGVVWGGGCGLSPHSIRWSPTVYFLSVWAKMCFLHFFLDILILLHFILAIHTFEKHHWWLVKICL